MFLYVKGSEKKRYLKYKELAVECLRGNLIAFCKQNNTDEKLQQKNQKIAHVCRDPSPRDLLGTFDFTLFRLNEVLCSSVCDALHKELLKKLYLPFSLYNLAYLRENTKTILHNITQEPCETRIAQKFEEKGTVQKFLHVVIKEMQIKQLID